MARRAASAASSGASGSTGRAAARRAASRRRRGRRSTLIGALCLVGMAASVLYLTQPLFGLERRPPAVRIDADRLRAHVVMLAETLAPRNAAHPDNLDRAAEYIRGQLEAAGAKVSWQDVEAGGRTYRNVVARLGPDTTERIVVGAHYDAAGPGIGADDNASGVAGLIELAGALAPRELPLTVELVAYTLEEPPYFRTASMGSAVHAGALRQQGVTVRAMLSLEMIGCFTDDKGSQQFPAAIFGAIYPTTGNFIAVVGCLGQAGLVRRVKRSMAESMDVRVCSINAPRLVPGIDFSDHLNYWDAGYDAVMITDTAFFRNTRYHEASDTPDTLDYARMANVVAGVCAAVEGLARDD